MAQPTPYERQYGFANFQAQHPSDPLPGDEVDAELDAVKASMDEIDANLALIQRDDGQLANGSVGIDQLSTSVTLGLTAAVPWTANTAFALNQSVLHLLILYRATAAFTSGASFDATNLLELADLSSIAAPSGMIGTLNIIDGAVTHAKLAVGAVQPDVMTGFLAGKLIGRYSATNGDLQTITVGSNLNLDVSGNLTLAAIVGSLTYLGVGTATNFSPLSVNVANPTGSEGNGVLGTFRNAQTGGTNTGAKLAVENASLYSWQFGLRAASSVFEFLNNSGASVVSFTPAGAISDGIGEVRTVPVNVQTGGAYTLVATDHGKFIDISGGGVTIPSSVFTVGQNVVIYNDSGSNQTITQGGGVTLRLGGTATTGSRTLAQRGLCTVFCVSANDFVINGSGLS